MNPEPPDGTGNHPRFERRWLLPSGMSIEHSLRLPESEDAMLLRGMLAAIARVHGDGRLPELPVAITDSLTDAGEYRWRRDTRSPIRMDLSRRAAYPGLTFAHEIGHLLDHQVLGTPGEWASSTGKLPTVIGAIHKSATFRSLRTLVVRRQGYYRYARYLLDAEELWARAYVQYIAVASGHPGLTRELDRAREEAERARIPRSYWKDTEFLPVARQIETLFWRLEWVR